MAVSLNSVAGFNSPLHNRHQPVPRSSLKVPATKHSPFASQSYAYSSRRTLSNERRFVISGSGMDDNAISAIDSPSSDCDQASSQIPGDGSDNNPSVSRTVDPRNGSASSSAQQTSNKRAPLTARERLRAARVLSRYTETAKPSKPPEMGSKLLDAMKESDKKANKKPGLPQAPSNLFDDSKRGLPKQGLTFQLPVGTDILIIAFSFVFISTVMFATTYIVWKLGAIHFNEY